MKRSIERIVTTHTGSLARPPQLLQMLLAKDEGQAVDPVVFDARVRQAVTETVRRQVEIGLTVINDGEQSKISFATYIRERLHGFGGADEPRRFRQLIWAKTLIRRTGALSRSYLTLRRPALCP